MFCSCSTKIFYNVKTLITSNNENYCCPPNSTIINGTCGCDASSTASSKVYVSAGFLGSPNFNPIPETSLSVFVCNATCPSN